MTNEDKKLREAAIQMATIVCDNAHIDMREHRIIRDKFAESLRPLLEKHKENIKQYSLRLIELHKLIIDGEGDSEKADDLRDNMLDDNWNEMSQSDHEWVRKFAVELRTIERKEK